MKYLFLVAGLVGVGFWFWKNNKLECELLGRNPQSLWLIDIWVYWSDIKFDLASFQNDSKELSLSFLHRYIVIKTSF